MAGKGTTEVEIRRGAYFDSVVLMQLQRALGEQPGILDAGVVMGTPANREMLAQNDLLPEEAERANPEDLVIVVRAVDRDAARAALEQVDSFLVRRWADTEDTYRPQTVRTAAGMLPEAQWVLVSTPGRFAAGVARDALALEKHVFLYSDNVTVEEEVALKEEAAARGLLVLGPDCGTAIVNGVGLGFANHVRRGPIGIVAASGTGLQAVSVHVDMLGSGITHAFGTGGRDLSAAVAGRTTLQTLDLLRRDENTRAIVLLSKPPDSRTAERVLDAAHATGKPIVVYFLGFMPPYRRVGNIHFASTFAEAAELAVRLSESSSQERAPLGPFSETQRYLLGLYSGGTLAGEAASILEGYLGALHSNLSNAAGSANSDVASADGNTVLDLGADEFTVGRLHPMLDNDLRKRLLRRAAGNPGLAVVLMDLVLGFGAHPDPAGDLSPAIEEACQQAEAEGRSLEVVVVVVGTEGDPQGVEEQVSRMRQVGARVYTSNAEAAHAVGDSLRSLQRGPAVIDIGGTVDVAALNQPLAAINVGLEAFADSLEAQGARQVHVDWRPPARGKQDLMALLDRMKAR